MSILDKYKHIDYDFRSGSISEKNGKADDLYRYTGNHHWTQVQNGRALIIDRTDVSNPSKYWIPHNSYQDTTGVTGLTLIAFGDFSNPKQYERILSKRYPAGGCVFDWHFVNYTSNDGSGLSNFDNTHTALLELTPNHFKDARMVATSYNAGTKPRYFINGKFVGQASDILDIPADAVQTLVGSFGWTQDWEYGTKFSRVIVVFEKLSDEEILNIYNEHFKEQASLTNGVFYGKENPENTIAPNNLKLWLDGHTFASNGKMIDLSGNNNHFSFATKQNVEFIRGLYGDAIGSHLGQCYGYTSGLTCLEGNNDFTISFLYKQIIFTSSSGFFSFTDASGNRVAINIFGGELRCSYYDGTTWHSKSGYVQKDLNSEFVRVVFKRENGVVSLYADGVELTGTFSAYTSTTYGVTRIGVSAGFNSFYGYWQDLRIWDKALSSSEINEIFEQDRKLLKFKEDFSTIPDSFNWTTNLSPARWRVYSGTAKIKDNKIILAGSSAVSREFGFQYGTFMFDFQKGNPVNYTEVAFMMSQGDADPATKGNGYMLIFNNVYFRVILDKIENGVSTHLAYTASNFLPSDNTRIRVAVTVSTNKDYDVFVKIGSEDWKHVDATGGYGTFPVNDGSVYETGYINIKGSSDDTFTNFIVHKKALTLNELRKWYG